MYGFDGWLLKVNGVEFPTSLIKADSYKATPDQQTDLDDYTDNSGVFHRNVLPAKATKIEFETKPVRLRDKVRIQELIPNRSEVTIEYWNDETNSYMTGRAYVPDISYEIYMVYKKEKDILYNPIRIAFIEYGAER